MVAQSDMLSAYEYCEEDDGEASPNEPKQPITKVASITSTDWQELSEFLRAKREEIKHEEQKRCSSSSEDRGEPLKEIRNWNEEYQVLTEEKARCQEQKDYAKELAIAQEMRSLYKVR